MTDKTNAEARNRRIFFAIEGEIGEDGNYFFDAATFLGFTREIDILEGAMSKGKVIGPCPDDDGANESIYDRYIYQV